MDGAYVMIDALKIDLGITTDFYDTRLLQYLNYAEAEIRRECSALDLNKDQDRQLTIMYAAWLWRKRDTGEGMPRMVRYALNNLIMHSHMKEEADG